MILVNKEDAQFAGFRGYATQFASAVTQFHIDDGQWVGRLIRVYGELNAPDGSNHGGMAGSPGSTPQDDIDFDSAVKFIELLKFLKRQQITNVAIGDVTYAPDPADPDYFIARGFIDVIASAGKAFQAGRRYRFEHHIKLTYYSRLSTFTDHGPIPAPPAPEEINTENAAVEESPAAKPVD